jgi:site-specific DNA-methyltransferase (adenine-specific)
LAPQVPKSNLHTNLDLTFLLLQTVVSQDVTKKNYCFVPDLGTYTGEYTDEMLKKMWSISNEEWEYIDSRISAVGGDE